MLNLFRMPVNIFIFHRSCHKSAENKYKNIFQLSKYFPLKLLYMQKNVALMRAEGIIQMHLYLKMTNEGFCLK